MSNLFSAFEKAPDLSKVMAPIGMPSLPEGGPQGEAPDLKGAIEEAKKAQEQLNAIIGKTADIEKEVELSKFAGNDQLRESLRLELERVDALAEQVDANKKLTSEQLMAIDKYKEATAKAVEIQINTTNLKKAESLIQSAGAGADAVVGNAITQIGQAFGPKGEIIAGVINLFRKGEDFMRNLGSELIKIIIELPLKIAEGMVGLVEGLLQGVIDMLADPARLAKIFTSLVTVGPKIMTSIIKALPQLLKALLDPEFWIEFGSQLIRSIWDAIMDLFASIGELFGIKKEKKEEPAAKPQPQPQMGLTAQTPTVSGYSEQLFGVQEDVASKKPEDPGESIRDAFDYGAKKTTSVWRDVLKFFAAPFKFLWTIIEETVNLIGTVIEGGMRIFATLVESLFMTFETAGNIIGIAFSTVWESAKIVFEGIGKLFDKSWQTFKNVIVSSFNFVKSIFNGVIDAFKAVFNFFKNLFDDPIAAFKQFIQDFVKIFENIWDAFVDIPKKLWEGIKSQVSVVGDTFEKLGNKIWDGVKAVWKELEDWFSGIGRKIYDGFSDTFKKIGEGFENFGRKIWEGFKNIIKETVGKLAEWLGLAEGGIVPGTAMVAGDSPRNDVVPALLSPGEAVIPRSLMANPEINKMISDLLNNRQTPVSYDVGLPRMAFSNGGVVPSLSGGGGAVFGDTNINVVMKIDSKEPIDEAFLRQRLVPALKAELKASSLRGDFVLSAKGVRR
jgi:hypothetical protein